MQTHRDGAKLVPQSAWFIYPVDVDLSGASEPVEVLKQFVLTFGLTFKVDGAEHRFLDVRYFPADVKDFKIDWPSGNIFYSVSMRPPTAAFDRHQLGLGYAMDITKYSESLRRHGIKVTV